MTNGDVRDLSPDMVHLLGVCAAARYFAESGRYVEIVNEGCRYRLKLDGPEYWQVAARTTPDRDAAGARESLVDGSTGVVLVMLNSNGGTSCELLRSDRG
ncbi:hypothetical protein ACIQUM_43625 [Amycolatopsis azurea]|uniref:hypothetical protein n=1 Tax=Amycolatopsis azurea TaxID=36819 RepID=UPI00382AFEB9